MKLQSPGFLTTTERDRLDTLEKIIAKGRDVFIRVGIALAEIKQAKLYRQTHKTFAEYCEQKWKFGRQYAYEMIRAAKAVESLPENVRHAVQNARQAEALSSVPEAKRVEVLEQAQAQAEREDRPVTARDISEVAESVVDAMRPKASGDSPNATRTTSDGRQYPATRAPKAEDEPDEKPRVKSADEEMNAEPKVPDRPAGGMYYAEMAIDVMSRIRDDDVEREQAFDAVGKWIKKNR